MGPLEDARAGELDAPQGPAPHDVRCAAGPKGWGARAARSRVSELACQKGGELVNIGHATPVSIAEGQPTPSQNEKT